MRKGMEPCSSGFCQSTTAPASSIIIPCTTCRMFWMDAVVRGRSPRVTVSQAYHKSDADPTTGVASRNQLVPPCQCSISATRANPDETNAIDSPSTRTRSFHRHWLGCQILRRPTGRVNLCQRRRRNPFNCATFGATNCICTAELYMHRRMVAQEILFIPM